MYCMNRNFGVQLRCSTVCDVCSTFVGKYVLYCVNRSSEVRLHRCAISYPCEKLVVKVSIVLHESQFWSAVALSNDLRLSHCICS